LQYQIPSWARQPASLLAETGEGGKREDDPKFRNYMAEYLMKLGPQISGGSSKWR